MNQRVFARHSGWPFVVPALAVLCVMSAGPLLWSYGMGFFRYSSFRPASPRFVGLGNYADLLGDADIWEAVRTTGVLTLGSVALQVAVGAGLAWLFRRPFAGRRFVLMLVLAPMLLSTVAVGTFFSLFYDPTFGIVSALVRLLTGVPFVPLATPDSARLSLIVADAWMWSPFVMLMLLAGLQATPPELEEAARIDRASPWRRFRAVLLPAIAPVLLLAVLFRVIESFNSFDLISAITNGGPGTSTETLATNTYALAFQNFQTGRASALAAFSACVVVVLVSLYLGALGRRA